MDRKRSNDTTSGGSNVTVIEGNVPDEVTKEDDEVGKAVVQPAALPSCLIRHDSIRASIKKRVRCSEATEVIPVSNYFINDDDWREFPHEDDDDVFSDSAPVQTPRGNMCTPYVERKGSLPGLEALPDWFPNSRLNFESFYLHLSTQLSTHPFRSFNSCFLPCGRKFFV